MPVPTYDLLMLPLLQLAGDGRDRHIREAINALAFSHSLTEADRGERLPSGKFKFDDRVQWANTYLKKAGLLESSGRGRFKITERGQEVLKNQPDNITFKFLMGFPEFAEFKTPRGAKVDGAPYSPDQAESVETPQDAIERNIRKLHDQLAQDLLEIVLNVEPHFFERLVVNLLVALGYGRSQDAGQVTSYSNDGGIDGIITEDRLGFDTVCVQAKKWKQEQKVQRPAVQQFAGSLLRRGVSKGVFITTSSFSDGAIAEVKGLSQVKIILIDGRELVKLMIAYGVGVTQEQTYTIKRVDSSYFEE